MTLKELAEQSTEIIAKKFEEEKIYETAKEIQNEYLTAIVAKRIIKGLIKAMRNTAKYEVLITEDERWTILNALFRYHYAKMQDMYYNEESDELRETWRDEVNRTQTLIERLYNL